MIQVLGLHHVGVAVADLPTACDFYCQCGYHVADRLHLVGDEPAIGNGLDEAVLDIAFLESSTLTLELLEFHPHGHPVGPTDPAFGSVPVCTAVTALSPEGNPLVEAPAGSPVPIELTSAEPAATARLLELFGYSIDGAVATGHGTAIELSQVPPVPGGVRANRPGRVHVCFRVADMDAAVSTLGARGHELVSSPRVSGDLQWVFVRHDEGPGIELLEVAG